MSAYSIRLCIKNESRCKLVFLFYYFLFKLYALNYMLQEINFDLENIRIFNVVVVVSETLFFKFLRKNYLCILNSKSDYYKPKAYRLSSFTIKNF